MISGIRFTNANISSVYDTLALPIFKFNIVVMHGQVAGYNSNEKAEVISIPKLKEKNVDYLALGHIHSYQDGRLDARGAYAYAGCLEPRGFDELGAKGFVRLEVGQGVSYVFEESSVLPVTIPRSFPFAVPSSVTAIVL